MALRLHSVAPARGLVWVQRAFRTFAKRPLAFMGLFAIFLFGVLLAMLLPWIGALLMLAALPLLTIGFMIATREALRDGPVHPGQFFEPLRAPGERRRSMILLCLFYAVGSLVVIALSGWVDGGAFDTLQQRLADSRTTQPELDDALANPRLMWGVALRFGLAALMSVPFWHAPALVHWGGQSAGQALFSSTLAVWRCRGAFLLYALAWVVVIALFSALAGLLFSLLGARQLAGVIALPAALVFSAVFYVSLYFTFDDSFGQTAEASPPAAIEA